MSGGNVCRIGLYNYCLGGKFVLSVLSIMATSGIVRLIDEILGVIVKYYCGEYFKNHTT